MVQIDWVFLFKYGICTIFTVVGLRIVSRFVFYDLKGTLIDTTTTYILGSHIAAKNRQGELVDGKKRGT